MVRQLRHGLVPIVRFFSSVRVRLTLWYLAILAVVFLVFGGILSGTTIHNVEAAEHANLTVLSTQVASQYDPTTDTLNLPDPSIVQIGNATAKQIAAQKGGVLRFDDIAVLITQQGDVKSQLGPVNADTLQVFRTQVLTAGSLRGAFFALGLPVSTPGGEVTLPYNLYVTSLTDQGKFVAWLIVGRPAESDQSLSALVPGLFIAGPLTLLAAALGGYWLASRAMRPVRLITRTAREIGETDLHRRLMLKRRDELGELAGTFDGMLDRLEAAFGRQRQFTADASHELRTPLTIVGLEVERALSVPLAPEDYRRTLETVQAENAYMGRLVNDLLLLARADSGGCPLRHEDVDLSDVALEVVERLAPLARDKGIELSVGALPELIVAGDRTYLARMVSNLVENAIKYAQHGGGWVRVESRAGTGTDDKAGCAYVRVTDNGPGILPEHLSHLFDRFYRVDAARSRFDGDEASSGQAGAGLGLAIVEWVARAHGGDVRVESEPGRGSLFEVALPLASGK